MASAEDTTDDVAKVDFVTESAELTIAGLLEPVSVVAEETVAAEGVGVETDDAAEPPPTAR